MVDDVILNLPATVKARTERIVIDNSDPDDKQVYVYQSLRPVKDGHMGLPAAEFVRKVPVDAALLAVEIDGISALQVVTWLSKWAAAINATDGAAKVAELSGEAV
jgi:hypothetical protein